MDEMLIDSRVNVNFSYFEKACETDDSQAIEGFRHFQSKEKQGTKHSSSERMCLTGQFSRSSAQMSIYCLVSMATSATGHESLKRHMETEDPFFLHITNKPRIINENYRKQTA